MENNKNIQTDSFADTCRSIISGVISAFLLTVVVGLPLYLHDSYFDILQSKYQWYYVSFLIMLAVVLILSLIMLVIDFKEFGGEHAKALFSTLKPKNWKKTFHPADAAVILFWVASVISTFQSEYFYESFWGNEGRYSGLFLMTLYVVMYFVVSRFWKWNSWMMQAFLAAGMVVCGIGITDYFRLDILNFRAHINPDQSDIFTSTLGNINTYTAYVALVMAASAAMFATAKGWLKTCWYYFCLVVSFFAIILGCSDNAYLALGAMFALLPLLIFRNRQGIVRYLVILATFATVIQCIDYINQVYADIVIGLDSLFKILVNLPGLLVIVILLWCLPVVVALYFKKQEKKDVAALLAGNRGRSLEEQSQSDQKNRLSQQSQPNHQKQSIDQSQLNQQKQSTGQSQSNQQNQSNSQSQSNQQNQSNKQNLKSGFKFSLVQIWLGLISLGVLAVVLMLIDANALGHGERYGSLGNYLVFNDNWGTMRGYIWRKSLELYANFPLMHKLFGYGPDTFGIMTTQTFMGDMVSATSQVFDTAHNEYLQYLLTIGPIGLVAYLVFLIGNFRKMAQCWIWENEKVSGLAGSEGLSARSICVIGCMFAVICYCAQAMVNLNLPITAPVMWGVMSMGVAYCRKDQ